MSVVENSMLHIFPWSWSHFVRYLHSPHLPYTRMANNHNATRKCRARRPEVCALCLR